MKIKKKLPVAVIIDDDEFYVMILKKLMSICQFADTVLTFQNGKEAYDYLWMVKEFPHQWPDVIFLDINMPVMNGFQFLDSFSSSLPALEKQISIYILSSSVSESDMKKAKSYAAVSDYLIKPITKEDLGRVWEEVKAVQCIPEKDTKNWK